MEITIERSSLTQCIDTQGTNENKQRKVPVLSLADYTDGNAAEQLTFINELYRGLKEYGFIILKNHQVDQELLRRAYEIAEKFFALSEENKMKYGNIAGGQRGYTPFGQEHAKNAEVMDLKEFWHVGRQVDSMHRLAKFYPANVWPTADLPEFEQIYSQIYSSLNEAGRTLLQALSFPLEVPSHYFDNMVEDGNSILRLLHYPPIPEGVDPRCVRAAAHEDINLITILPAATASGLQLLDRDGVWLDIECDPGSLIVDAGDMLARITNDVIPATTHRVINPLDGKNVSRYSMPFFMHPNPEAILSCLPSCRGTDGAKYTDITAHDFLIERLREIGLLKN